MDRLAIFEPARLVPASAKADASGDAGPGGAEFQAVLDDVPEDAPPEDSQDPAVMADGATPQGLQPLVAPQLIAAAEAGPEEGGDGTAASGSPAPAVATADTPGGVAAAANDSAGTDPVLAQIVDGPEAAATNSAAAVAPEDRAAASVAQDARPGSDPAPAADAGGAAVDPAGDSAGAQPDPGAEDASPAMAGGSGDAAADSGEGGGEGAAGDHRRHSTPVHPAAAGLSAEASQPSPAAATATSVTGPDPLRAGSEAALPRADDRSMHGQADPARTLPAQIADLAARGAGRPMELVLSPDELGRVRMAFHHNDGALTLSLAADRSDTLDLMRRHIDGLARDLRALGFASVAFDFGQGAGDRPRLAPNGSAPAVQPPEPAEGPAAAEGLPRAASSARRGGLDMRL